MGWNENSGTASRAFDDWRASDSDTRAFVRLAKEWSAQGYEEAWNEAERASFDPDAHHEDEHVDDFHQKVGGPWPDEFDWVIRSAAIKDAVTAFEVYLEVAAKEALDRYSVADRQGRQYRIGLKTPKTWETPGYDLLVKFHRALGTEIDTRAIKEIRALRHLLTHQRGKLRTEEQRQRFADDHVIAHAKEPGGDDLWDKAYVGGRVQLRDMRLGAILDELGRTVRTADPAIWAIAWDKAQLPDLGELRAKKIVEFVPI